MSKFNDNQRILRSMISWIYPGDELPEEKSCNINGINFSVSYHIVNRKCFDNLPTPTVQFKANGKRVSKKTAFELLA